MRTDSNTLQDQPPAVCIGTSQAGCFPASGEKLFTKAAMFDLPGGQAPS